MKHNYETQWVDAELVTSIRQKKDADGYFLEVYYKTDDLRFVGYVTKVHINKNAVVIGYDLVIY